MGKLPWLFNLIIIILRLFGNISTNTPLFDNLPHQKITSQTKSQTIENTKVPVGYTLDAWSQYNNPEEGAERKRNILELRREKEAKSFKNILWPQGIVYYFVDYFMLNNSKQLALIEDAMETIMNKTCIRFKRIYADKFGKFPVKSWVNITGDQKGCFSDLGRNPYEGSTLLNLNVDTCFSVKGHALHEIFHTLGLYHEHMRPDRDHYIKIIWENIRKGDEFNFRMKDNSTMTNYELPYDYRSIMHYSMTAFSKDKSLVTIVPLKPYKEIGQRSYLSNYDVLKLLKIYKCNNKD